MRASRRRVSFSNLVTSTLANGDVPNEPRGYSRFARSVRPRIEVEVPVVDLFCGAGGSALGALWAGFAPRLVVDIDRRATETFRANFVEKLGLDVDVLTEDARNVVEKRELDLDESFVLVGCPPCQGFSTIGKKNPNDERNELVLTYLRFAKKYKPVVVTFENVFGMRLFDKYTLTLIIGLRNLGYEIVFGLDERGDLDAMDLAHYGVPQRRKRVVVVATRNRKFAEYFEPPRPFRFPRWHLREVGLPESYALETVREWIGDLPPLENGERDESVPNHVAPRLAEVTMRRIKMVPKDGGSLQELPKEYWIPCHRRIGGGCYTDVLGRLRWDEPSVTIRSTYVVPTTGRFVHPEQDRALSVREGARLQTFTDDFEFPRAIRLAARLVGNALPPRFSYVLMRSVREALEWADLT